ncbi:putative membrane protein, partial [Yersinia pestis PY-103]
MIVIIAIWVVFN